jgi:hypothetical protein
MKYRIYFLLITFASIFTINNATAQDGVAINNTSTHPDSSAMLDVSSTSKGMLVPRMDSAQRVTIHNPAIGLLVYQTDGLTPGFYNFNGTVWLKVGASIQPHQQIFSTAGTYTFTTSDNITSSTVFKITMVGAGGPGGGGIQYSGGGGGSGAYVCYWVSGLKPNTAYTCVVGTGGVYATSDGTATTITLDTTIISCGGGFGGGGGVGGSGGRGGSVTVTAINGQLLSANGNAGVHSGGSGGTGGNGGPSVYGGAGLGNPNHVAGYDGNTGGGGGGGGGGANGGNGGDGIIIIEWSE